MEFNNLNNWIKYNQIETYSSLIDATNLKSCYNNKTREGDILENGIDVTFYN